MRTNCGESDEKRGYDSYVLCLEGGRHTTVRYIENVDGKTTDFLVWYEETNMHYKQVNRSIRSVH